MPGHPGMVRRHYLFSICPAEIILQVLDSYFTQISNIISKTQSGKLKKSIQMFILTRTDL